MAEDPEERTLALRGLHCAGCAARVERALAEVPGVASAHVNFATRSARVTGRAPVAALLEAVARAGYAAAPLGESHRDEGAAETSAARRRFIVAAACALPVAVLGMVPLPESARLPAQSLSALLATAVLAGPGGACFARAARLAVRGATSMDTLIALGAGAAWLHSLLMLAAHPGGAAHLYFESAAVIVTLVLLGRWLEARARHAAGAAVTALLARAPATAVRCGPDGDMVVPAGSLQAGDELRLRPGDIAAVDGVVVSGVAALDESLLTGEPLPVRRGPAEAVTAGAAVIEGSLVVRAARVGRETSLAQTAAAVERALGTKAEAQRLADRVSAFFVPAVMALALVTFMGWRLAERDLSGAAMPALSVLLIACPCALGLATPAVVVAASGRAAREGLLIAHAAALERAGSLDVLICDKTGTLTEGRPDVVWSRADVLPPRAHLWIAAAERGSAHPAARAIVRWAARQAQTGAAAAEADAKTPAVEEFSSFAGRGIVARVEGHALAIGSPSFVAERCPQPVPAPDAARADGAPPECSPVWVALDGARVAEFGLADTLRPTSAAALRELAGVGIEVQLATGDGEAAARAIGGQVGLAPERIHAGMTPEGKQALVEALKRQGRRVGFVGDGVNDAGALTAATVGFAIGGGADVAARAADIALKTPDIQKVLTAVRLARRARRIIAQNLAWAFGYNLVMIPLAGLGALNPMLAAGAMACSSVTVVLNALRVRRG